jgi:hypothetical protein
VGTEQDGIFGKLPESRPGIRSPRRRSTQGTPAPTRKPKPKPQATSPPPPPAPSPGPRAPEPPTAAPSGEQGGVGLEDLAWAGVAAAAEAATIGVRLASRAMEALRGPTERR